jgi:hypothetical protein
MKLTPWLLLYIYSLTASTTTTAAPGMWYYLCVFFILLLSRCLLLCATDFSEALTKIDLMAQGLEEVKREIATPADPARGMWYYLCAFFMCY